MRKKIVLAKFWVVGILAVVLIFEKVKAGYRTEEIDVENSSIKRKKKRFPRLQKRLIGSEGGSQNKCITKRG